MRTTASTRVCVRCAGLLGQREVTLVHIKFFDRSDDRNDTLCVEDLPGAAASSTRPVFATGPSVTFDVHNPSRSDLGAVVLLNREQVVKLIAELKSWLSGNSNSAPSSPPSLWEEW